MNRHLVVIMSSFSAIAPRQLLLDNSSCIVLLPSIHGHMRYPNKLHPCNDALPYYRPSDPHGKDCSYNPIAFPPSMEVRCGKCGICKDQSSAMDIRVAGLRNSPAHYAFMARVTRLEAEHFNRQSIRPRLNQGFPNGF